MAADDGLNKTIKHITDMFEDLKVSNAAVMVKLAEIDERQRYLSNRNNLLLLEMDKRERSNASEATSRFEQLEEVITTVYAKLQKIYQLESTVRKQEIVILKMEGLLGKYQEKEALQKKAEQLAPQKLIATEDALVSLTKQNNRLKTDLLKLKDSMGMENKELKSLLERAENREATLQQELAKNGHEWAHERRRLSHKLAKYEKRM